MTSDEVLEEADHLLDEAVDLERLLRDAADDPVVRASRSALLRAARRAAVAARDLDLVVSCLSEAACPRRRAAVAWRRALRNFDRAERTAIALARRLT